MIIGLYQSTAGALAEDAKQSVNANNLANINTPGFKRDIPVFRVRPTEINEDGLFPDEKNEIQESTGGGMFVHETYTDFSQGDLEQTSNPFDMAIFGKGFFAVEGPAGDTLYTRAGAMQMDAAGYLTDAAGHRILSQEGGYIPVGAIANFIVSRNGQISDGNAPVGNIGLFEFSNLRNLQKVGDNLYKAFEEPTVATDTKVEQGALESSGVNAVEEMVRIISAFRAYEGNMQMIRGQDQNLRRLVNDVARV